LPTSSKIFSSNNDDTDSKGIHSSGADINEYKTLLYPIKAIISIILLSPYDWKGHLQPCPVPPILVSMGKKKFRVTFIFSFCKKSNIEIDKCQEE